MSEHPQKLDRDIDPQLAAMRELCSLMIGAKTRPNEWVCHPLGVVFNENLRKFVTSHGFEVRWDAKYPAAASIRWVGV